MGPTLQQINFLHLNFTICRSRENNVLFTFLRTAKYLNHFPRNPAVNFFSKPNIGMLLLLLLSCISRQSCPTLCDPIDGSPTGASVPGILQAKTLEWVAISFSDA